MRDLTEEERHYIRRNKMTKLIGLCICWLLLIVILVMMWVFRNELVGPALVGLVPVIGVLIGLIIVGPEGGW